MFKISDVSFRGETTGTKMNFGINSLSLEGFAQSTDDSFWINTGNGQDREEIVLSMNEARKLKDYLIEAIDYYDKHQPKEMTVKEIEEKLGHRVKIVK